MNIIKRLYITGYKSAELGIFQANDPKISIIKQCLEKQLISYLENGLNWVIISVNLGIEIWAAEVVEELKKNYPELKLGIIYPFKDFGSNWNEQNKEQQKKIENLADYCNSVSHQPYYSPIQYQNHTKFLLEHTDGCLVIYDPEYTGKTAYFLEKAQQFSKKRNYTIQQITMDDLQNCQNYEEYN